MSLRLWSWLLAATLTPVPLLGQATLDSLQRTLEQRAARSNAEWLAARAALRTLEARIPEAAARDAPVLSLEVDEVPGGVELWNAGQLQLSVEQELFTGRRRGSESLLARSALRQRQAETLLLQRGLSVSIARALARWTGECQITARLRLEDELLQDVERSVSARFSVGDARYVDVLRVRTERLRVQSELSQTRASAGRALARVVAIAGDTAGLTPLLTGAEQPVLSGIPSAPTPDSLLSELQHAGLFSLARSHADAIALRDRAARATRITGSAGIQRFGTPGDYTVGPALRLGVSLPFLVSRSNRSIELAAAGAIQQGAAEDSARWQRARSALLQAQGRLDAAADQVRLFDSALLSGARSEREAVLASYRTGSVSLLELLDFERALARAEIDHVRALLVAHDAWADLLTPDAWFGPAGLEGTHDD